MTDQERENERRKLTANWCNTLSAAVLTAGCIAPVANYLFGALPSASNTLIYGTGVICIVSGIILHSIGQAVLGALE